MHVELANLDTEGLSLQLPSTGDVAREVRIAATKNLRGVLTQTDGVLEISDARAKSVLLDALRLLFGSVLLEARGQTRLGEVRTDVRREQAATELRLEVESLATPMLRIEVGSVLVAGNTAFRGGKLEVHGSEGAFEASSVHVGAFYLGLGSVGVTAPELRAERLTVSWGKEGFRLDAEVVDSPRIEFKAQGTEIRAMEWTASRLKVHRADVLIERFETKGIEGDVNLVAAPTEVPAEVVASEKSHETVDARTEWLPIFDWRLLDALSGYLHVDLGVEVRVPLIKKRRATHKLRILLERGSLDFRDLEKDLESLEDALLDFSVREGFLVLELGIPLLPTRGLGKPLVRWPLSESDRALAGGNRVRLATLARPERVEHSQPPNDRSEETSAQRPGRLQRLGFEGVEAELNLREAPAAMDAALRELSFDVLRVRGSVVHTPGSEPVRGRLQAGFSNLFADLDDLPFNRRELDARGCRVATSREVTLDFEGARPVRLRFDLQRLSIDMLGIGQFAR